MANRHLGCEMETVEDKEAIAAYAKAKGFSKPSELVRVALISWLKQRPPKKGTDHHEALKKFLA